MNKSDIKHIAFAVGFCLVVWVLVGLAIRLLEIIFLPYPSAPRAHTGGVLILAAIIAACIVAIQVHKKHREYEQLREWARANKPEDYGVYPPVVWDEWKKLGIVKENE